MTRRVKGSRKYDKSFDGELKKIKRKLRDEGIDVDMPWLRRMMGRGGPEGHTGVMEVKRRAEEQQQENSPENKPNS